MLATLFIMKNSSGKQFILKYSTYELPALISIIDALTIYDFINFKRNERYFYNFVDKKSNPCSQKILNGRICSQQGFTHVSRDEIIQQHTRSLAQKIFSNIDSTSAILVLNGTFIYIPKSGNYAFSERSYSLHQHLPLLKLTMIVFTTGYIVTVLGPYSYLADAKKKKKKTIRRS